MHPDDLRGAGVVVAGAGVSGLAAARALVELGARVTVTDAVPERLVGLPDGVTAGAEDDPLPPGAALVVTGPGRRPDHPLTRAGVPVVGETELAWWLGAARERPPRWLVVTGTNGKTTTTEMLAAILLAAGRDAVACGNIGYPAVDAVRAGHEVLAVELSSFQLHWSPSIMPAAGCVLNVAEDHLDWHGSMAAYAAAKARALLGPVAIAGIDDARAAALLAAAPAPRRVGVTLGEPRPGQLGVVDGVLVDRAFGDAELIDAGSIEAGAGRPTGPPDATDALDRGSGGFESIDAEAVRPAGHPGTPTTPDRIRGGVELIDAAAVRPSGPPGITDALAAAALARADGVGPDAVRTALEGFRPGRHRAEPVATVGGVTWVDDSKATNPHAADASLAAVPAGCRVVWIAGGLLKGASVDDLVARHAGRLRGAVVIGTDRSEIVGALARHAPEVPVTEVITGDDDPMTAAVTRAAALARPGDVVLLAPAAASMDQFRDYAARGDAFASAVARLGSA